MKKKKIASEEQQIERWTNIRSKIARENLQINDIMSVFGYTSYEGFKLAIKLNRKKRYDQVLVHLKTLKESRINGRNKTI